MRENIKQQQVQDNKERIVCSHQKELLVIGVGTTSAEIVSHLSGVDRLIIDDIFDKKDYPNCKTVFSTFSRKNSSLPLRVQTAVADLLDGHNLVIIYSALGGMTGSINAPKVAQFVRTYGKHVITVCSKPFSFEASFVKNLAEKAIEDLRKSSDGGICISFDKIMDNCSKDTSMKTVISVPEEVLKEIIEIISQLVSTAINKDMLLKISVNDIVLKISRQNVLEFFE